MRVNDYEIDLGDDLVFRFNGELFTGISVEYHRDGWKWSEFSIRDGLLHGPAQEWNAAGQLISEDVYERGRPTLCRDWDENGKLTKEAVYELGIRTEEKRLMNGHLVRVYNIAEDPDQMIHLERRRAHVSSEREQNKDDHRD